MFGILKRKIREVKAPVDGQIVKIESVNDEVFSEKMAGDGIAIIPIGNIFTSPIDGIVTKIFSTNHAYSIKNKQDLEVLVHIGLETVSLEGKGFERMVNEGDSVSAGDPIIKVDLEYIKANAKDIITPILISDVSKVKSIEKLFGIVKQSDIIMRIH